MHSETCDWTFVLLTQESRFWRNADYMATVFLFTLAVVLLMGILLTVALVRKNYRPLSQTIASIAPATWAMKKTIRSHPQHVLALMHDTEM